MTAYRFFSIKNDQA